MKQIRQFYRIIAINIILAKHGLDKVILSLPVFSPLRFLMYINPWNWFRQKDFSRGVAIRLALEQLGPIFVKFGQALSTRRDLLPDDIADQLVLLQDRVPPFSNKKAFHKIEEAYGKPLSELFREIDTHPIASASIAQVYGATLLDGRKAIVKVRRPGIRKLIKSDVALMYTIARIIERYWSDGKRLHPVDIVAEFEKTILDELDFMREAANASQLRRNFHESPIVYVPEIYWSYARENVIVMERIYGIPITDVEELKRQNFNIKKLAERGVEIFFTQVFRDSFFHADMHAGNIFVALDNKEDPQYISVDFGIMGSLSTNDQRYLAENFLAFFNRDYRRVAELHVESGWVAHDTRVEEFEADIRTVCEPFFEKPLSEISCAQMLMRLFQTGKRYNMEVQPQLILLQKTLFAIEGLGRQLYPDLDLWSTAKPFLQEWVGKQMGFSALFKKTRELAPYWLEKLPEMPMLIHDFLYFSKQHRMQNLKNIKTSHEKEANKKWFFIYGVAAGLFVCVLMRWFS
ncbi:MAG: ubiquinone biosynthesis regulatory protein kinase UbiB [Proteobacteria bacterium]|nr:ubiquinone biosynthesis regulatory protein kinase UbiB [Pseudomonadota bacterium]